MDIPTGELLRMRDAMGRAAVAYGEKGTVHMAIPIPPPLVETLQSIKVIGSTYLLTGLSVDRIWQAVLERRCPWATFPGLGR